MGFKMENKSQIRIKGGDGVISITTKNTKNVSGKLWELKCENEKFIPTTWNLWR